VDGHPTHLDPGQPRGQITGSVPALPRGQG
jgi:hypothetical protein